MRDKYDLRDLCNVTVYFRDGSEPLKLTNVSRTHYDNRVICITMNDDSYKYIPIDIIRTVDIEKM